MLNIIKADLSYNINILLYHQIGDKPSAGTNLDCFCTTKEFYLQMEFLKHSDHMVITLNEALDIMSNTKALDRNYVVLTFDDGCEKFYDIAFPILDKFNLPSIIYPVAGFLGKRATWGGKNYPDLKILSKSMLSELSQLGVDIGAHTMNHVKLTEIKKNEAVNQVIESKEVLEQLLGKNINSFAYPHGDFNSDSVKIVAEAGFNSALTCISGFAQEAKSVFEIPRKYITFFDNLDIFKLKLN